MEAEYQLSPRIRLLAGDPVKVADRRGMFRFVGVWTSGNGGLYADVIGPLPHHEILRTVPASALRSAGRATRASVAMNEALREFSRRRR